MTAALRAKGTLCPECHGLIELLIPRTWHATFCPHYDLAVQTQRQDPNQHPFTGQIPQPCPFCDRPESEAWCPCPGYQAVIQQAEREMEGFKQEWIAAFDRAILRWLTMPPPWKVTEIGHTHATLSRPR